MWDPDDYLGEAHCLLSDNGHLLLSTHETWLYHPHPTDFWRWTRSDLLAELPQRNFTIKRIVAPVGPLAWTTQFRAIEAAQLLRRLPLVGPSLATALSTAYHLRMMLEDALTPRQWIDENAAVYAVLARNAKSS